MYDKSVNKSAQITRFAASNRLCNLNFYTFKILITLLVLHSTALLVSLMLQRPQRQPYGSPAGRNPADLAKCVPEYGIALPMGDKAGYTQAGEPSTRQYISVNVEQHGNRLGLPFPSFPADRPSHLRSPPRKRGRTLRQRQLTTMEDLQILSVVSTTSRTSAANTFAGGRIRTPTRPRPPPAATTSMKRPQTASMTPKSRNPIYGGGWKNRPQSASSTKKKRTVVSLNFATRTASSSSSSSSSKKTTKFPARTRLKRRSQRGGQRGGQRRGQQRLQTGGPETNAAAYRETYQATFVSLELDSMHNNNNSFQFGRRTNSRIPAKSETTRRRGWRPPKKTPTYTRRGRSRNSAFGLHREFTPVRPDYYSLSQNGVVRIEPTSTEIVDVSEQKNVHVINMVSLEGVNEILKSTRSDYFDAFEEKVVAPRTSRKSPEPGELVSSPEFLLASDLIATVCKKVTESITRGILQDRGTHREEDSVASLVL